MPKSKQLNIKRIYEPPAKTDGFRIFVDRLWARGLKKETAGIDLWIKDIAPSNALRKWFNHDPAKWSEFKKRYVRELKGNAAALSPVRQKLKRGAVTLLYAAKDEQHNNAVVLREYLLK